MERTIIMNGARCRLVLCGPVWLWAARPQRGPVEGEANSFSAGPAGGSQEMLLKQGRAIGSEIFVRAVAAKMAAGLPRHEAFAAVCREQPAVREAFVREHNAALRVAAHTPVAGATRGVHAEAFERAVACKMELRLPRHEAFAAVCREQPVLREAFVAEFNARARRKVIR